MIMFLLLRKYVFIYICVNLKRFFNVLADRLHDDENETIYVVWAYIFGNLYQFKWICVDSVAEGESYGIDFDMRHMFAIV